MPAEFEKRVVIVTGSGRERGIGAATALEFAERGAAAVVIASTTDERRGQAQAILHQLQTKGAQTYWFIGDLTDESAQKDLVRQTIERFQRLDILVNNASVLKDRLANAVRRFDWDLVMNTNARMAFELSRTTFRYYDREEGGAIVNIGSVARMGNRGQLAYAAAKGALTSVTRTLALEWASRNIRVNQIDPGFIDTDMTAGVIKEEEKPLLIARTPLRQLGSASEIAFWVANLASPRARFTTGTILTVDGGISIANIFNATNEILEFRAKQSRDNNG